MSNKKQLEQERKETIARLRELCAEFGDNDWPDDMYIPDIIEKHLAKYLWDSTTKGRGPK